MSSLTRKLLQQEKKRRVEGSSTGLIDAILKRLSDKQRNFVMSKKRFKVALCPRRAGKTEALASMMIIAGLSTAAPVLYLGLTRDSAKAAVWTTLLQILERHSVAHEARPSSLEIKLSNGALISLFGGDTPNARNRLRGRKFALIVADESGFVRSESFDQLIFALLPSLADYKGSLAMASSPGEVMDGLFYHAYQGDFKDNWEQHHWDILENPFFMGPAEDPKYPSRGYEELDTICRLQFGGNWKHPTFEREYRGKYVKDLSRLIYPYTDVNLIDAPSALPDEMYGMGIDFGVTSESAIVVGKFSEYTKEFQIVDSWSQKQCSVDELAAEIISRQQRFNTMLMIGDSGGLGAASVLELRRRYQLPIKAADKKDKAFFQRMMANDLMSGYIKVVKGLEVLNEWDKLVRDDDGEEKKGLKNHEADAALYLYRYAYSVYTSRATPKPSEEQVMIQDVINKITKEEKDREDGW